MPNDNTSAGAFLKTRQAKILTVVLLAQAALFYSTLRKENVPSIRPLSEFPSQMGPWRTYREGYVDAETQAVLLADDTLTRVYAGPRAPYGMSLFVAFFKTQRTGQAPHSPKNCLPGAGWEASSVGTINVNAQGEASPLRINRYVVSKGDQRSVVLYWYQAQNRVIASEYEAKMWLVADSIRRNRTDTALVRVISPVSGGDEEAATRVAMEFVQAIFPSLRKHLPS